MVQVPGGGGRAAASNGTNTFFGDGSAAMRQVQCPLPPAVVQVRRRRRLPRDE